MKKGGIILALFLRSLAATVPPTLWNVFCVTARVIFFQRRLEGFSKFQRIVRGKVSWLTGKIFCGTPDKPFTWKTSQILIVDFTTSLRKISFNFDSFAPKFLKVFEFSKKILLKHLCQNEKLTLPPKHAKWKILKNVVIDCLTTL